MECTKAESLLIDYIDDQLSPGDKNAFELHIHSCEACRLALEEYRQLLRSIDDHRVENPGPALREKFDIMLQTELNIDAATRMLKDHEEGKVVSIKRRPLLLRVAASIILMALGVVMGMQDYEL